MSNFDFKINPDPIKDDKIRQYQDFDGLIRAHNIKSGRAYRRSSDVPLHRSKWVVLGFMAFCAIALFGAIMGFFATDSFQEKTTAPIEKDIEQKQDTQKDLEEGKIIPLDN